VNRYGDVIFGLDRSSAKADCYARFLPESA
jgi:hypothetical protein